MSTEPSTPVQPSLSQGSAALPTGLPPVPAAEGGVDERRRVAVQAGLDALLAGASMLQAATIADAVMASN